MTGASSRTHWGSLKTLPRRPLPSMLGLTDRRHTSEGEGSYLLYQWRREVFWRSGHRSFWHPLPFPFPPLRSRLLKPSYGVCESCKVPQWGLGRNPSHQRCWYTEDLIETLLMTSKMCIVLCTWFVIPCPSLPQQSAQNFCLFRVAKKLPHPLWWRPGHIPLCPHAPPLLPTESTWPS